MYGGCGTAGNRARWACSLFFLMAVGGLWAFSVIERMQCKLCDKVDAGTTNCRVLPNGRFHSYDSSQVEITECSVFLVVATFFGGVVALIFASIPFFTMCCCAQPPQPEATGVNRISKPEAAGYPNAESIDRLQPMLGPNKSRSGNDWVRKPIYQAPKPLNKPDLSHLGLDGLPIAQPTSSTGPHTSGPPTKNGATPHSYDHNGGVYVPPEEDAYSQSPHRTSPGLRRAAQHELHQMHAASPGVSPRPSSGTALLGTPDRSPLPSPRNSNRGPSNHFQQLELPQQKTVASPNNPYYSTKPAEQHSSNHYAHVEKVAEETGGLNSFGRKSGPDQLVTPRGRFTSHYT